MTPPVPESHRDLLEQPIIVTLVTVTPENKPHAVAVWRKFDGERILIAIDYGTRKHKNVLANPSVAVMALDPRNPGRYLVVNGVAEAVEAGALAVLDDMTHFYLGHPTYYGYVEPMERKASYRGCVLRITPERYITLG